MFLLWLSLSIVSAGYLLYVGLLGEKQVLKTFGGLFMLSLLVVASYKLLRIFILYGRLRQRGWNVSLPMFLFHYEELGAQELRFVPAREEFQVTPQFSESRSEMANLQEALYLARGWDSETRLWREMVPVYTPTIPQTIHLIEQLLRDEGILAVVERTNTESTYGGATFSGHISVPKAQYNDALDFLRDYFENNEAELSGLHGPKKFRQ